MGTVFARRLEGRLQALLTEEPVVLLGGPRASGKSFTSERVIADLGGTVRRLDDPAERGLAAADPTGYLQDLRHPVLIDEYQHVPALLAAIKVDLSRHGVVPGRYLLTGSVRADLLAPHERLTGRVHRARMHPLSEGEFRGEPPEQFLTQIINDPTALRGWRADEALHGPDYVEILCRGGFPVAVQRTSPGRARWFRDYVEDTVLRDALDHAGIRKPEEMLRLLRLLAAHTARIVRAGALENDLQLDRHSIAAYREILRALFLVDDLSPWRTSRSQRVIKSPKLHLTDSGLAASLLGIDSLRLRRDPVLAGQLLESFVVAELRKQASWMDMPPTFLHFSEPERSEVDVVIERADGAVIGLEVKLADHAEQRDFRGLRRLRELAGDRWAGGVLLAALPAAFVTEDRLLAAPLSALWAARV